MNHIAGQFAFDEKKTETRTGGAMTRKQRGAGNLELVGERLCLDWTNTVSTRLESLRREYLTSYGNLLEWSLHAGILTDSDARRLGREAARRPIEAKAVLDQAIAIRETIYRILAAIVHQRAPAMADIAALNAALAQALARLQVIPSGRGFEWQWVPDRRALDVMLWPVVRSAADLLTSADLRHVRQCARREGCDWLFVDTTKNHSRRWCSMSMCGSIDKARRYYQRKRAARRAKA
jgi:predicted RNA-binding Zn ribbon-like protein